MCMYVYFFLLTLYELNVRETKLSANAEGGLLKQKYKFNKCNLYVY